MFRRKIEPWKMDATPILRPSCEIANNSWTTPFFSQHTKMTCDVWSFHELGKYYIFFSQSHKRLYNLSTKKFYGFIHHYLFEIIFNGGSENCIYYTTQNFFFFRKRADDVVSTCFLLLPRIYYISNNQFKIAYRSLY